ncbi:tetratricopeptide repeat protein [Kitasatospora sp. NPDC058478]|uniref:tetratricopeptide repeat protein n=1 Tax=unclassified Kitasatospora TaxID=2633591 RepID=UPI00366955EB
MNTLFDVLVTEARMDFRSFLAEYRRVAALLYERTGDIAFRNVVLTDKSFTRWRAGQVARPHHPAPAILERMYGKPVAELFAPCTDEQAKVLRAVPTPVLDERELAMTARDARAHAADVASQLLPDLSLDQLEDDLVRLVRANTTTPPHEIFMAAKELLGLATVMLDRTQLLSQRGRLYVVAGQASALLGACAFDLGSMPTAVELMRASALYGQVAEHGPLQAYAHGYLALLYYWGGNPAQAVRQIERAHSFRGVGATGQARLAAIAARSYAHLGRAAEAHAAIDRSLADRGPAVDDLHDGIAGEFDFSVERVAMSNSTTLLLLRDGVGAEASALRSLELIASQSSASTPLAVAPQAGADLATALLMRRDLDGAAEAMRPVLSLPREWRGAGLVGRVNAVRAELASPSFRDALVARDLAEQIDDFTLVAAPRTLGPGAVRLAIDGGIG